MSSVCTYVRLFMLCSSVCTYVWLCVTNRPIYIHRELYIYRQNLWEGCECESFVLPHACTKWAHMGSLCTYVWLFVHICIYICAQIAIHTYTESSICVDRTYWKNVSVESFILPYSCTNWAHMCVYTYVHK